MNEISTELSSAKEYLRRRIEPASPYESLLSFPRYFEVETVNACCSAKNGPAEFWKPAWIPSSSPSTA